VLIEKLGRFYPLVQHLASSGRGQGLKSGAVGARFVSKGECSGEEEGATSPEINNNPLMNATDDNFQS
jgi:hypothetical protein